MKKVTKDTTDDELMEPVIYAKNRLARETSNSATYDQYNAEDVAQLARELAIAEGQVQARYEYRNALAYDATPQEIRKTLTDLVLRGADDTWSGRSGDIKRSKFDGLRGEVRDLLLMLDREARA